MIRSNDITSVTDCRAHLREHLDRLAQTGRPLYITSNGTAEAVLLSATAYDELAEKADLGEALAMIRQSKRDIAAGRTQDAREAMRELAQELGIRLDR
jgi:prevent-host-death family protein